MTARAWTSGALCLAGLLAAAAPAAAEDRARPFSLFGQPLGEGTLGLRLAPDGAPTLMDSNGFRLTPPAPPMLGGSPDHVPSVEGRATLDLGGDWAMRAVLGVRPAPSASSSNQADTYTLFGFGLRF
ncbi:MAG: hypothetical protein EAZ99_19500 [Alphaproteobacteria bacterium]|nr:MAG: hypothetical protein EAZ99_19500 [Alphaproteobacteria bacterium]